MRQPVDIHYHFELKGGESGDYRLQLDPKTLLFRAPVDKNPPPWTRLEVDQCADCPLKPLESPFCPIALNLSHLIEKFEPHISFEPAKVTVTTNERQYVKETTVQYGLFSIFGVIMATSGCPVMDVLRPMARFHLPFASHEEAIVRSVSMYLFRQYVEYQQGKQPDLDLKRLDEQYLQIQKVNTGIIHRIRAVIHTGDASVNAVGILHSFATLLGMAIRNPLETWEYLFPPAAEAPRT